MSRAALPEVPSTHPIGALLPALYAADDFALRFTAGLDDVLSAVLSTLDNLTGYLDPALAPADFLVWLSSWVAERTDPRWPEPVRRELVRRAVGLHRDRGTAAGLAARLRLALGVGVRILDGPGVAWSASPDAELPGAAPELLVQVWPDRAAVDRQQVMAVVAAHCPLHLVPRVEVLAAAPESTTEPESAAAPGSTEPESP
ncbi:phage tail protein [Actinokineospora diospyrosa]|uniref:Phage tail protein domain-containing protein n=1 Tax=Actinokineospora diospyrosa TaxID=103728 RepID=A0ABT1IC15_9PSEU|nr:phage tail protein [Actinokineospora diospyrosa]MCP2270108.1 phage tail protein domain-containing protein [Actinokineospora diospyrosa]